MHTVNNYIGQNSNSVIEVVVTSEKFQDSSAVILKYLWGGFNLNVIVLFFHNKKIQNDLGEIEVSRIKSSEI